MVRAGRVLVLIAAMVGLARSAIAENPPSDWTEHPVSYFAMEGSPGDDVDTTAVAIEEDCCPSCNSCQCRCWDHCCRPLWTVNAGAIFLTRSTPHRSPILEDSTTDTTLLNSNDFNFNWATGADVQVTRRVDRTCALDGLDVRYFGVQSWQANTSLDTAGPWQFPNSDSSLPAAEFDSVYRSQLYSVEANAHHNIDCTGLTWLAGARWLQLNDQLNIVATDSVATDYRTTTQNKLYGAQIGMIVRAVPDDSPITLRWTSKAGVYGSATRNYWSADSTFLSADGQGQLAFVGDVNVTAAVALSDHVSLQGGYQLLWIEGVAVAGDQFAVMQESTTQDGINSAGGAFFQGATASINVRW
ncbi:MAG: hypothetical protein WD845_07885 [Pirellulales bacterium]